MTLSKQEEREKRFERWDDFWAKESKYTSQTNLTPDTRGIIIDFIQSEIDLALAERDREVVEKIDEMERDCVCSPLQTEICDIERTFRRTQLRIINLITNK